MTDREYLTRCRLGHRGYLRLRTVEVIGAARCHCGLNAICWLLSTDGQPTELGVATLPQLRPAGEGP